MYVYVLYFATVKHIAQAFTYIRPFGRRMGIGQYRIIDIPRYVAIFPSRICPKAACQ